MSALPPVAVGFGFGCVFLAFDSTKVLDECEQNSIPKPSIHIPTIHIPRGGLHLTNKSRRYKYDKDSVLEYEQIRILNADKYSFAVFRGEQPVGQKKSDGGMAESFRCKLPK